MSKDTPDKTDLSSMSKEELIAYLLKMIFSMRDLELNKKCLPTANCF